MTNRLLTKALGLLTVVGISAAGIAVIRMGALTSTQPAAQTQAAQVADAKMADAKMADGQIAGNYNGQVALKFTLGGVYSDSLATPTPRPAGTPAPADVGQIDLALFLNQTGNAVSGYINLEKSLVFSMEHTIQATPVAFAVITGQASLAPVAVKIGPYVQGTFDGTNLSVQSERITQVVAGRTLQRQFRVTGTLKSGDPNTLVGEYRETLWGYGPQALTVLGVFEISRPFAPPLASNSGVTGPQTVPDTAITRQGLAVTLNVLSNDSATNGGTLTITSVSSPLHGTASTNGSTVTYTPSSNFAGVEVFNYFVSDGKGGTAVGSISVRVTGPVFLPLAKR